MLIAYPICFYLYGSLGMAVFCIRNFSEVCIPMILFSPIFMIMGPLGHDEEDPPNIFGRTLIFALLVVAIWTLIVWMRERRRIQPEQGHPN